MGLRSSVLCLTGTSPTSLDLPRCTTRSAFILPRIWFDIQSAHTFPIKKTPELGPHTFPRHATLITRPFPSLPKPTPSLLNETRMTRTTIFGSVILLSRTVPADHAVGMFIRMIAFGVVAFITGEDFRTATEAKPAVALAVVGTAAVSG